MNGTFALVFVQILAVILCAVAAVLLFVRSGALLHAQSRIENACAQATSVADLAKREVEAINTTKYETVKSLLATCELRSNSAVNKADSIEESVKTLQNKLASRERQEKIAEKKGAKIASGDDEPETGTVADIDELIKNGKVFPLATPQYPPQSAKPPRRFGSIN